MSTKYPEYPYTNFPEELDAFEEKMDVTADLYNVVTQYKTLCAKGQFDDAKNLLKSNENLQKMVIDAMTINELQHAVMAIEKMWTEDLRDYVVKRVFDKDINIGEYTHTYTASTKIHNFAGDGKNARVMITNDYHSGDTFTLNGKAVSAYMGGASVTNLFKNQYMYFLVNDTGDGIYFIGGGDTSDLMPKTGGTFTGNVYLAGGTTYYLNDSGDAKFNAVTASKVDTSTINASGTITGSKVYGAVYNDYAEFFPRGEETEAGDIVALDCNSNDEKYVKAKKGMRVVGIHSEEYSHIIGGDVSDNYIADNMKNYIPVGLVGRCHCKVLGKVERGDFIVLSDLPGIGTAVKTPDNMFDVVGFAVESCDADGVNLVKVKLGGV